jgi:predicted nucleotidyltransferase component of viral defense system
MHDAIQQMLEKYQCKSEQDYINAIKEIFQEIALLGLWRAKFFEQAAFYGGSALRILYKLDRFSEDCVPRVTKEFCYRNINYKIN